HVSRRVGGALGRTRLAAGRGADRTRDGWIEERALQQAAGVGRSDTSPDDCQGVVSKIVERTGQCVCLGSDQAERPVTTSNFLRRVLTTSSALAWVQRVSSWPMIRVSAASTSVIAPSE